MYGVFKPKARIQATARLSTHKRFIVGNNAGINIGIKAICIGIIFCDAIAIKQIIKNKTHTRLFTTSIIR